MHRKLFPLYQGYKLFLFAQHSRQLPQKCAFKSALPACSRAFSSSQSSQGDGASRSPPVTVPETAGNQSQVEVKEVKQEVRLETTGVKIAEAEASATAADELHLSESATGESHLHEAAATEPEPQAHKAASVVGEPPLHEPAMGAPQLHEATVAEPQVHETAVAEPHLQTATGESQVNETVMAKTHLHEATVAEPQVLKSVRAEPQILEAVAAAEAQVPEAAVAEAQVPEAAVAEAQVPEAAVAEAQVPEAAVAEAQVPEAAVLTELQVHEAAPQVEPKVHEAAAEVEPQVTEAVMAEPKVQEGAAAVVAEPQVHEAPAAVVAEPQVHEAAAVMAAGAKADALAAISQAGKKAAPIMAAAKQPESSGAPAEQGDGGKKSLLELLSAMKVDVTTKRKVRVPRPSQSEQSVRSKAKPAEAVAIETTKGMFQEASAVAEEERVERGDGLTPDLVAAATAAASTLPNKGKATSELLRQLRRHEAQTHAQQQGGESIGNIIADMKVGRQGRQGSGRLNARPTNQIRFDEDGQGYTHDRGITSELDGVRRRKSVFAGKRLNVFTAQPDDSPAPDTGLSLWDLDLANRIATATNQLPRNGFEEMLLWTNQGKLWQYPINNEAGLESEVSVPFHEHVFLERHLAEGFPSQGPVRHFMELVITGLAKNPYLTATQKQEHIAWFKDYFQEKRAVLEEAEEYAG